MTKHGSTHTSYKCAHCGKFSSMKNAAEGPEEVGEPAPDDEIAEHDSDVVDSEPVMSAKAKVRGMLAEFRKRDGGPMAVDKHLKGKK